MTDVDLRIIKDYGFIKYLLNYGADIASLELEYDENETLASMNPSIWINEDGSAYINIRAVNYNLLNSRYREYTQNDQPIAYVCKDQNHLKTERLYPGSGLSDEKILNDDYFNHIINEGEYLILKLKNLEILTQKYMVDI